MNALVCFRHMVAAALAVSGLMAFASNADAQTRTFDCGKGRQITLTVTGPNSISARPIEGGTLNLKKSPKDPLLFVFGPDYSVKIAPSQTDIEVHIADFGLLKCNFKQAGAPPAPPPVRGCEEGFRLVKGQCVRQAVGAVKNPCGPGMRPVPETDRCVPVGTSKANEMMPITGRSFGGIVRSAPNIASGKVASLAENEPVMLVQAMNVMMGGYDWFKIEFKGRTGYQWGGILCSDDPVPGILSRCEQR